MKKTITEFAIMEKRMWDRARRLYVKGYGLAWIKQHTGLSDSDLLRALQLPYGVHGPVELTYFGSF